MIIEYNNGSSSKPIKNVVHIAIKGDCVDAILSNGTALSINLDNISGIIDNDMISDTVKSHWIKRYSGFHGVVRTCSVCGCKQCGHKEGRFCANCGAEMSEKSIWEKG